MGRKSGQKKERPDVQAGREAVSQPRPATHPYARPVPRRTFSAATAVWAAVLVAAAAACYASALGNPFLLDDPTNITKNADIQKPLGLVALLFDPRALVTASLRWNYRTGGFSVAGYHALNIVAHAIAGLLVFALARTTLRLPVFGERYRASAEHLAGVAALLFLVHPMQTESVTYVIQRAEIFVLAALTGTLLALVTIAEGRMRAGMAALAVSCVAGIYSKPSFAVAPALMLVYDLCFLSRGARQQIAGRWPAYALATAAAAATFVLTHFSGTSDTAGYDIEGITPLGYFSAQFGVFVHYLRRVLWPAGLCFDCGYRGPWPVLASFLGDSVVLPLAMLTALGAAALAAWRRQPLFTFAFFASGVALAPASSVVPLADFYVEHRMYAPIAFLAMALVPAGWDAACVIARRSGLSIRAAAMGAGAVAAGIVVALGVATVRRNALLANPIALMEASIQQAPQSERLHYNLANAYKRDGRLADAEPHYREAIRLLPHVVRSYQNLGSLYLEQGKLEAALEVYLAGAAAKPSVSMAHRNVAGTYLKLGRPQEALEAAERSLAIEPSNPNGQKLVAEARRQLGN